MVVGHLGRTATVRIAECLDKMDDIDSRSKIFVIKIVRKPERVTQAPGCSTFASYRGINRHQFLHQLGSRSARRARREAPPNSVSADRIRLAIAEIRFALSQAAKNSGVIYANHLGDRPCRLAAGRRWCMLIIFEGHPIRLLCRGSHVLPGDFRTDRWGASDGPLTPRAPRER